MPSNPSNLVLKTVAAATIVLLFIASLAAALIAGHVNKNEVVFADCQAGSWACSPSGAAMAMIDGGGMYKCVNGLYQQQTACGAGAKCCMIDNAPKCIALAATCGAAAEPDACDISSADAKTCCKCDTGAMCLGASNTYRKCIGGCYRELSCGMGKSLCNQITQPCPAPQTKCSEPGSVVPSKKADGAHYLNICGTDYISNEIQCSLTLKQKEAATCYEAQTNGLLATVASIESDDGFTITSQRIQTGVDANFKPTYSGTKFVINDSNGMTDCQNLGEPAQSRETTAKDIRGKLGCAASHSSDTSSSLCQSLELACCLTGDHCLSKNCDQNIVYDSYYGCTKINFGKQLVVKKSDGTDCGVCALKTFGCGEGLTTKDSSGVYAYKKCEPNTDTAAGAPKGCWGPSLPCGKDNADCCDQVCANASEIKTWSKDALANVKTKTIPFDIKSCPKTFCSSNGAILVLDNSFTAKACNYKRSLDVRQSICAKCRKDAKTNEAVCEQAIEFNSIEHVLSCNPGAKSCGDSCYNPGNGEDCYKDSVICIRDPDQMSGDYYDASKNYYPYKICNRSHLAVLKADPERLANGKDGTCHNYDTTYEVCGRRQTCSNGQCINDVKKSTNGESVSIPGKYDLASGKMITVADNWQNGALIDRETGKAIDTTNLDPSSHFEKEFPSVNGGIIDIVGDKQGLDTLNAAIALIGSSNIKQKTYFIQKDSQGNPVFGPGTNTYVCANYATDTQKMLIANGIKDAYIVTLIGSDANGKPNWDHEINAVKVGEVKYPNGYIEPTFALIDPQTDQLIGQLGAGGSQITDAYNEGSQFGSAARIDAAGVAKDCRMLSGSTNAPVANGNSEVYTYTTINPYIGTDPDTDPRTHSNIPVVICGEGYACFGIEK